MFRRDVGEFARDERAGQLRAGLVQVLRAVPQSIIVRDRVEELPSVECTREEGGVPVCPLDDVYDGIDRFASFKRFLRRQAVLYAVIRLQQCLGTLRRRVREAQCIQWAHASDGVMPRRVPTQP